MKKIMLIILNISIAIIFFTGCGTTEKTLNPSDIKITTFPTTSINVIQEKDDDKIAPAVSPAINPTITPYASISEDSLAIEAYKSVLQNKTCFYDQDGKKNIYLNDFLSYEGNGYEAELRCSHFAVLDMDEDKISEIVLDLSFYGREGSDFYEVLQYMNGTVYGYLIPHRGLEELKGDGTFIYSGGAGDWGFAKLKFSSDNYEYTKLGYCESNDNGELFFIDNNPCTEKEFDNLSNRQEEKATPEWSEISQENVGTELTSTQAPTAKN